MSYCIFLIISSLVSIIGALFFAKKNKWPVGRVVLPLLAVFISATGFSQYFALYPSSLASKFFLIRLSCFFHAVNGFLLLELIVSFLGKEGIQAPFIIGNAKLTLKPLWRCSLAIILFFCFFTEWFSFDSDYVNKIQIKLFGQITISILFLYQLLILFQIEKIFRLAPTVQKRIFMLFLSSMGILASGSIFFIVRILFYQEISFRIVQVHSVLYGIFFPGILIGLARYRLWQEKLAIGRGIVYTSFTVLFFSIFLIILGIIASFVRYSQLDFNEFEEVLIIFSVLFFGILTIFSPQMRTTITVLSRKYIYKSKYDYRDQLLRLHTAHQSSGNVQETINAFIDNLQYTIVVKNAYVFTKAYNENLFVCVNKKNTQNAIPSIRANSPLLKTIEQENLPAINCNALNSNYIKKVIQSEDTLFKSLSISHLFSIRYNNLLLGILCIECGKHHFDSEDLMLITMFCESIGAAIFRENIQSEHIQQKQFESFNHMASFIIHDIKNQVATLNLLSKNAHANINDPEFHPVLLRSLENCSVNFRTLIGKLQSPPRKEKLTMESADCNDVIKKSIVHTKALLPEGIILKEHLETLPEIPIDSSALYFIINNLVINAVEALGKEGTISISSGSLQTFTNDDTYNFCLTPSDRTTHTLFLTVEDNGPGIKRSFLENNLFKPFNTTKDKGIGIGLYQSKILVESMNGRLLCWSEENKGTRFCILL